MGDNGDWGKIRRAILSNPEMHPHDIAGLLGLEQTKKIVNSIAAQRNALRRESPGLLPKLPMKKRKPLEKVVATSLVPSVVATRRAILHFPHLSKEELQEIILLVERQNISQGAIAKHRVKMLKEGLIQPRKYYRGQLSPSQEELQKYAEFYNEVNNIAEVLCKNYNIPRTATNEFKQLLHDNAIKIIRKYLSPEIEAANLRGKHPDYKVAKFENFFYEHARYELFNFLKKSMKKYTGLPYNLIDAIVGFRKKSGAYEVAGMSRRDAMERAATEVIGSARKGIAAQLTPGQLIRAAYLTKFPGARRLKDGWKGKPVRRKNGMKSRQRLAPMRV